MLQSLANYRFCVAPMMDWTDRHCRFFHRQLSRRALLYTEMVTAAAVIHGDAERLLDTGGVVGPVALQLGGSEPDQLHDAVRISEHFDYHELNLNVGCPSDRVQSGRFGACLMAEPERVADCVAAMRAATARTVTVKCRIGIDDQDSERDLDRFIDIVADAGCKQFIIHARKAWLDGLSPKENRDIPPLDYERVRRLKKRRPDLTLVLNGGLSSLAEASEHMSWADGVMLGRAAYQTPGLLARVDRQFYAEAANAPDMGEVIATIADYTDRHVLSGGKAGNVLRHLLGLFSGRPGARAFRRTLSETMHGKKADGDCLRSAYASLISREQQPIPECTD